MNNKIFAMAAASVMFVFYATTLADDASNGPKETRETQWLIIHAGNVIAIPGEAPLIEQTIIVKDGKVAGISDGYADPIQATGGDTESLDVLDLKDAYVLPGLMDMHVHLSFEFGNDGQQSYDTADEFAAQHHDAKDDAYAMVNAISNAAKTLEAGFTTVRNVGSEGWHIFALRDAIRDDTLTGPRIIASGHPIRIGADDGSGACASVESCRRETRKQIDMGANVIKTYTTCSGSKPCGHQFAPSVFLEDELRAVVDVANTRGLKVAAHAHGTDGINLAASVGVSSIEHGSFNNNDSHKIMRKNGIFLVPTLAVQDNIHKDIEEANEEMTAVMQNFLDNHGPRMLAAHKAGVRIAMGSDAGVTKHGNNARELEFYVENGLRPEESIIAATINAAALLGMEDELGTIEAGKIADIIAVKGDPLKDVSVLKEVTVVIKDGIIVKDAR